MQDVGNFLIMFDILQYDCWNIYIDKISVLFTEDEFFPSRRLPNTTSSKSGVVSTTSSLGRKQ